MHILSLSLELEMQDTDTSDAIDDRRKMYEIFEMYFLSYFIQLLLREI